MKIKLKKGGLLINMLIAVAISLIVNFSYFVMIILSSGGTTAPGPRHMNPADNIGFMCLEIAYYFILALIILLIFTVYLDESRINKGSYWKRLLVAIFMTAMIYFFAPYLRRNGQIIVLMSARRVFNPMVVLKCSFTLAVAALYGKIYELIFQKQSISIENERLRSENLQSRYDMLVNQINPHFFFNSLNSLSMLVRENKNDNALSYIDRLSDTFRYILETGRKNMTTLAEELRFAEDYKYMFEIRYEGKFFLDINIDEKLGNLCLPSLSLQPLIENAVKHNTITKASPLHISITSDGEYLSVSNRMAPKIDAEHGTGIGLRNLASRYRLLTDKDIVIIDDGATFTVKLPLTAQ